MTHRKEESIVEGSDGGGDISEKIVVVDEQMTVIMNSIVTVGESSLNQRLSDMRKDVEKFQIELDKSVRMVEEMMMNPEKLKNNSIPDESQESNEKFLRVGQ